MKAESDWKADLIKIAAIATAAPRWVGALLAAEGFSLPADWLTWWVPLSAVLSAGMAIVEGLAFAYVFEAWRNQSDKDGDKLFAFAIASALVFVGVLAPYIAASVKHVALSDILTNGYALAAWSVAVGFSTIAIVASVGYAQKRKMVRLPAKASEPASESKSLIIASAPEVFRETCPQCDYVAEGVSQKQAQNKLNAHMRIHTNGKVIAGANHEQAISSN